MCSSSVVSVIVIMVMAVSSCCGVLVWICLLLGCIHLLFTHCKSRKHKRPRHKRPKAHYHGHDDEDIEMHVIINPVHTCWYREICERFLKTLSLSEEFFEPDPKFNLCFCEDCLRGRQDRRVYERGNPPKKYTIPTGWTRFSLRVPPHALAANAFNEWHVAFHGTASKNVRKILETGGLVLPGSQVVGGSEVNQPIGHYTKGNKPTGFDVDQIFVSPSIKYSGCEVYARATDFQDPVTMKTYKCRVVFQVLIKPGSYAVGKETIGSGHIQIDSVFDNSEIEWSTKQYGSTILYELLIKAEKQ